MATDNVSSYVYDKEAPNLIDKFEDDKNAKAKTAKEDAEARGEKISKMLDYNPSEVWGEYDQEIRQEYEKEYIDDVTQMWANDRTPTTEDYARIAKKKNRIEGNVAYYNGYKENFEATMKTMTAGEEAKYYNSKEVNTYFGGISHDENGNKRSRNELTNEAVDDVYNQREIYNSGEIWKGFVSEFGKATYDEYSREHGGLMKNTAEMSKIFVMDGDKPDRDDEGNLKLKPSKEAFAAAMEDPMVSKQIEFAKEDMIEETGNENVTNFEAFQARIGLYSSEKETSSHTRDFKPATTKPPKKQNEIEKARLRKLKIKDIQTGNKAAINELVGTKSGNRFVVKAVFNDEENGITVTYGDDTIETIPSSNFDRLNNLYSTIPNQEKVSNEALLNAPEAPEISKPTIDEVSLEKDISTVITGPVKPDDVNYIKGGFEKGKKILESIPGVSKVKYKKYKWDEEFYTGIVSLTINDIEQDINLFSEEGAAEIKEMLLERKSDKYMTNAPQKGNAR